MAATRLGRRVGAIDVESLSERLRAGDERNPVKRFGWIVHNGPVWFYLSLELIAGTTVGGFVALAFGVSPAVAKALILCAWALSVVLLLGAWAVTVYRILAKFMGSQIRRYAVAGTVLLAMLVAVVYLGTGRGVDAVVNTLAGAAVMLSGLAGWALAMSVHGRDNARSELLPMQVRSQRG